MEPQTVVIPRVVPGLPVLPVVPAEAVAASGPAAAPDRLRVAATVGVAVVGVAALSTAVFQSVVGSSTTLRMDGGTLPAVEATTPGTPAVAAAPDLVPSAGDGLDLRAWSDARTHDPADVLAPAN